MTVSDLFNDIDALTLNKFRAVSDPEKLAYLNRAIIALYLDIKWFCQGVYTKEGVINFASGVAQLPADFNHDSPHDMVLYQNPDYTCVIPSANYRYTGGKLRSSSNSGNYYIEYTKEPTTYTLLTEDFLEDVPRAKAAIMTKIEVFRDQAIRQGQNSGQAQGAQERTIEVL